MNVYLRKLAVVAIALGSVSVAQADLIEVTAVGSVYSSQDDFNLFGLGNGANTILDSVVTATWIFDTDDAPPDLFPTDPTRAQFRDSTYGTDWIYASVVIDTPTVDTFLAEDIVTDATASFDSIRLLDGSTSNIEANR